MTILNVRDANTGNLVAVDIDNPTGNLYVRDANTGNIVTIDYSNPVAVFNVVDPNTGEIIEIDLGNLIGTIFCQDADTGKFVSVNLSTTKFINNSRFFVILNHGTKYEIPAYTNAGGMGDRTATITITPSAALNGTGNIIAYKQYMINGNTADDLVYSEPTGAVDNTFTLKFLFPNKVVINEAKFYHGLTPAATHGTWKWQLDVDNDGTWVDVGDSFILGGSAIQIQTTLAGNTTLALAYRIVGISGNVNTGGYGYWQEWEFKVGNLL